MWVLISTCSVISLHADFQNASQELGALQWSVREMGGIIYLLEYQKVICSLNSCSLLQIAPLVCLDKGLPMGHWNERAFDSEGLKPSSIKLLSCHCWCLVPEAQIPRLNIIYLFFIYTSLLTNLFYLFSVIAYVISEVWVCRILKYNADLFGHLFVFALNCPVNPYPLHPVSYQQYCPLPGSLLPWAPCFVVSTLTEHDARDPHCFGVSLK